MVLCASKFERYARCLPKLERIGDNHENYHDKNG